jgi:photosystem II stability/assembly factor-like uncharacterized protein
MKKLIVLAIFFLSFTQIEAQWSNCYNTGYDMKSVFFVDINTGWAIGNSNTIVKTTNGGNSWFSQNSGLAFTTNFNSVCFYDNQNGFIVGDPNSGTTVIIRTTNGGTSWQLQPIPVSNYKLTNILFIPNGPDFSFYTSGYNIDSNVGSILKSTDYGNNWIQTYNRNGRINTLHMEDTSRGYAGGDSLIRTQNGGNSWIRIVPPQPYQINKLFFLNYQDGWMCTEGGKIYSTSNNGNTWQEQLRNTDIQPVKSVFFLNDSTGLACTSDGKIYRTDNAGKYWTKQITGISTSLVDVIMVSDQIGFAVGTGGNILRTINGGGNFSTVTKTFTRNNVDKPLLPNLLTSDTIHINAQQSEELITITDINISIDTVLNAIDSNLIFIITHEGVSDTIIYKVGENGNNFIGTVLDDDANKRIELGKAPFTDTYRPSRPLSQVNNLTLSGDWIINIYHLGNDTTFNPLLTGVIKAWGMVVTYNVALPQITGIGKTPEPTPAKFTLNQNYPNPFNPTTKIKFSISKSTNATIKVYNVLGVLVKTLIANEKLNAGIYEIPFDGSNLASGVYFYRFETPEFNQTMKMVLVK